MSVIAPKFRLGYLIKGITDNIFWIIILVTLIAVPAVQIVLIYIDFPIIDGEIWNPFRSKLAATIMNGLRDFPFMQKSSVLYLGVSTGTTISHISDIVGQNGIIFGIEHTSRVARDFLDRVASHRKNIIPIIQDARKPQEYFSVFKKVDVVYVDIAQPDQTDIAIANCKMYLKSNGYLFLVIKTRSIDVTKDPKKVVSNEIKKLDPLFEIKQIINLHPYDKDHVIVIAVFLG